MISKWYELKNKALILRRKGKSIRAIEQQLSIPRSTLSGWFRNIKLSKKQKNILYENWQKALVGARKEAVKWHNQQKQNRLQEAKSKAIKTLQNIDTKDKAIIELALSMLYLGEGSRINEETSMGSSNPLILKFFLSTLRTIDGFDDKKIKCQLSLRADQDPDKIKLFWSKELKIPIEKFGYIGIDKRTIGSKTYPDYKGVCLIRCSNVAIKRELIFISEMFCKKIIKNTRAVSSVG